MREIIVFEISPPRAAAAVPFILLAACVMPTLAVIVAIGLLAPVPFMFSAFRELETAGR